MAAKGPSAPQDAPKRLKGSSGGLRDGLNALERVYARMGAIGDTGRDWTAASVNSGPQGGRPGDSQGNEHSSWRPLDLTAVHSSSNRRPARLRAQPGHAASVAVLELLQRALGDADLSVKPAAYLALFSPGVVADGARPLHGLVTAEAAWTMVTSAGRGASVGERLRGAAHAPFPRLGGSCPSAGRARRRLRTALT